MVIFFFVISKEYNISYIKKLNLSYINIIYRLILRKILIINPFLP